MSIVLLILSLGALLQGPVIDEAAAELSAPAEVVSVETIVDDASIETRLAQILETTGLYQTLDLDVRNGVVFLTGHVDDETARAWVVALAGHTEGVIAVSDRIAVREPAMWDLEPAIDELARLWRAFLVLLPRMGAGLVLLLLVSLVARRVAAVLSRPLSSRFESELLKTVIVKFFHIGIWLFGAYLFLRISGLTQIAMTIVGGTGILGIVLGFAFRDIAENFLASVLISLQSPFRYGDTIEVEGHQGVVQRVTPRGTILMDFEGNYIQIANARVYKSTIKNFTANPNVRQDFLVGIGYDASVTHAQEVVMKVLAGHSAVLEDPKPMVLVEQLAPATINLRVYFWVNGQVHSKAKVRSALMRMSLRALEQEGVSMPDDAREVIFPMGVPVRMLDSAPQVLEPAPASVKPAKAPVVLSAKQAAEQAEDEEQRHDDRHDEVTEAEGDLESEVADLNEQARLSRSPEEGADIL